MCIFKEVPAPVMVFSVQGRLIDANDRCYHYHGVDGIKKLEARLMRSAEWEDILFSVHRAKSSMPTPFSYSFTSPEGKKWVKAISNRVLDTEGNLIGISILGKDITLKHNMLSELKQMQLAS